MRRKEKNNKNLKKIIIILSLIFIILYSMQAVKTFSIYVYNNVREFYLKSNNFYFYSDKLKLNKAEYSAKNWSGIEDYIININMNSMENNSVRCNSNIEYTISYTCSDNILCQLSKTKSTIYASDNVDNFIVTITPKAELQTGDVVWLEVEATSTYPYVKTISGRFEISIRPGEEKEISFICSLEENIDEIDYKQMISNEIIRQGELYNKSMLIDNKNQNKTKQELEKDELTRTFLTAIDNFIVYRPTFGLHTVIAGYPWFLDWGRDTLIAFEGLFLKTKRFTEAREVLLTLTRDIKYGLVPNRIFRIR